MRVETVLVVVGFLVGCGASNTTRVGYAAEAAKCVANEQAILERAHSTEEQDRADLATERARCDAELARIEAQR